MAFKEKKECEKIKCHRPYITIFRFPTAAAAAKSRGEGKSPKLLEQLSKVSVSLKSQTFYPQNGHQR
ncbi:hypothetical protein Ahy_B09g098719 isoform E [Arachis hypogaea]|uniref:Uncharacterized protein n=1 Tax=Arachis hypogaea TaxID=3818 RepID=A0A444XRX3_ARAHY|nr:hypothetical protein Ahy_B09g098719 isoform E [Arachis hypogaea]